MSRIPVRRHRSGTKDGSFLFIDSNGKKVRWCHLVADVKKALPRFWAKRGVSR